MEKVFEARDSPLTEIFSTKQGAAVYSASVVVSLMTIASNIIVPLIKNERIEIGQDLIWKNCEKLPLTFGFLLVMYSLVLLLYLSLVLWSSKRPKQKFPFIWNMMFLPPALLTSTLLLVFPPVASQLFDLPEVCSVALIITQLEIFFKLYSFLRYQRKQETPTVPTLKQAIFYLAVPTFIYSENYPRSDKVRSDLLFQHFLEMVWCVIVGAFVAVQVQQPIMHFRSVWLDYPSLIVTLVSNGVVSTLLFFIWFIAYLHSFGNFRAELTGFQDRMFYKDWWTSRSLRNFFVKWNTLFQDWLYHCVYVDVRNMTKNHTIASSAVFLVAIIFHEWLMTFVFHYFFPVLGFVYTVTGVTMALDTTGRMPTIGNAIILTCVVFGNGLVFTGFMMEMFARKNCPYPEETDFLTKFFYPRTFFCPITE